MDKFRLIALAATVAFAGAHSAPAASNAAPPAAVAQPLPEDYLTGAWWLYKSVFVENGRVIDRSNGNISHSEGQGYGMLIAVAARDREGFDAIWNWTRQNMYVRDDALAAWKWDPAASPHVVDDNNATDGDLLIAWALERAGKVWNVKAYRDEAKKIADAVAAEAILKTDDFGPVLLPAAKGFAEGEQPDGPVVNLSYWIFPAIAELGALDAKFPARELIASGTKLLGSARFGAQNLPADWISLKGGVPKPAQQFAANFGFEAVRIPLYTAWYNAEDAKLLTSVYDRWFGTGTSVVQVVELATASPLVSMGDPGYRAVSDVLACSLGKKQAEPVIGSFEPTEYYPSTLHLVSIVASLERYPQCL